MPTSVEFYISNDNINFTLVDTKTHDIDAKNYEDEITHDFSTSKKIASARYVKVIAKNYGKLPEWHQGAGGDAYIFIDEITVK